MRSWWLAFVILFGCQGCFWTHRVTDRISSKITGPVGWFHLENTFVLAADGGAEIPPAPKEGPSEVEAPDYDEDEQLEVRMKGRFERSMIQMVMDSETPCPAITGSVGAPPKGPVYLLVHGIRGAGIEWYPVLPLLEKTHPAAMFMFRWQMTQDRSTILDTLGPGMDRIVACYPNHPIYVIAHSAGGVLMAFEASRLTVGEKVVVYTVASPLAGVGYRSAVEEDDDNTRFLNDLGAVRHQYSAAAPNVEVVHLRTSYPADNVMKPNRYGRPPNQRGVGVEGAREVDLPEDIGHDESLIYVARQIVQGKHF
ncbi:MAG: hypothetical protein QM723_09065 [Myxococcaceae bacterium]